MLEILQTTRILLMYVRIIYENLYQQDFFDTIMIAHFFRINWSIYCKQIRTQLLTS